jgi:ankyrin repeat protein
MALHTPTSIIDKEFEHLKNMRENRLNKEIMNCLDKTQNEIQLRGIFNPRGPYKKSLIHFAAMGDCTVSSKPTGRPYYRDDLDHNKRTPLSWAAEYGSLGATKILLKNGAKVNSLDDMYCSPLTWLIHAGSPREATRSYHKENGATTKGAKRAWILNKLRLL